MSRVTLLSPLPHTVLACTGTTSPLAHDFSVYYVLHWTTGFYEIWLPFASRLKFWQVWFYGLVVEYNMSTFQLFVMFREPINRACFIVTYCLLLFTISLSLAFGLILLRSRNRKGTPVLLSRLGNNPRGSTSPHLLREITPEATDCPPSKYFPPAHPLAHPDAGRDDHRSQTYWYSLRL